MEDNEYPVIPVVDEDGNRYLAKIDPSQWRGLIGSKGEIMEETVLDEKAEGAELEVETKEVIKPLGSRVVVKKGEAIKQTAGGIFLPDNAEEKPQRGTVVAVGPGKWNHAEFDHEPMPVKPGDVVLFPQYQGTTVKINDDFFLVFDLNEILAVIDTVNITPETSKTFIDIEEDLKECPF